MAVEPEENARTLDVTFLWQVHAPVHVFVSRVIGGAGDGFAAEDSPFVRPASDD